LGALRDILERDHPTGVSGNSAIAVLILVALIGRVAIGGPVGLALLVIGCVLAAAVPFAGVLAIAFSLWTLPLLAMPAVVSDIRPDELILLAALAGASVRVLVRRDLMQTGVERGFVIFLVAAAASVTLKFALGFEAPVRSVVVPMAGQMLHLLLFVLVVWAVRGRPERSVAVATSTAAGAVVSAVLGIAQYFSSATHQFIVGAYPTLDGGSKYPYVPGGIGFRATSAFDGNPNHFGVALAIMALCAASMAERSDDRKGRVAWSVISLLMLTAILFTTSRTAFLAAFVLMVVGAIIFRSRLLALITTAWVALTLLLPSEMPGRLLDLLGTRTSSGMVLDPSVAGRISAWTIRTLPNSRVLPLYDNYYLDLLNNFGPLALAGFAWLLWTVGSRLLLAVRRSHGGPGYPLGALAVWIALTATSFTAGFFATQRVAELGWILVALAFAGLNDEAPDVAPGQPEPRPRL
jgi:hypothetical protein